MDITQSQIAEYLNIHQTTYSDYEIGKLNMSVQVLEKIADLFGTSIDYLVNRTDIKKTHPRRKYFMQDKRKRKSR